MENYNRQNIEELSFNHRDENGVVFVDAYFLNADEGKSLGYIIKGEFYPKDQDYLTDAFIMDAMKNFIADQKAELNSVEIGRIDFKELREQKQILIRMIQDWGEADDANQRKDSEKVEGLLSLLDKIQDEAVDKGIATELEVFGN